MSYTHSSIRINAREVQLADMLSRAINPGSAFEEHTFSFIKSWLQGAEEFTLTTSGSTGAPKEITLSRNQLEQSAQRTIKALTLSSNHAALVCLDTRYIAGKMMLVRALEANMKIIAVEPASDPVQKLPVNHQPDFAALVPLQLETIFSDPVSLQKIQLFKTVILGGAAASESLKAKIKTLRPAVYATYGMTETVSHIALQKLNGPDAQEYFETLPDVKIKTDERDCLVIELPGFNETIITNDLVKLIDDSHFEILGRYDTIINSGGVKLVPETIERKIEPLLINQSFFVAGIADDRLGQKLILLIEGEQQETLPAALKLALSAYEVPKKIVYLNQFIRTGTGKINRPKTLELLSRR
jgi:o-succinylbenzoate---CoA ligase